MMCRPSTLALAVLAMLAAVFPAAGQTVYPEKLEGHGGPIRGMALAEDGRAALTASFDYSAILWRFEDGKAEIAQRLLGHDAAVNDGVFVPGRPYVATVSDDGSMIVWSRDTGDEVKRFSGPGDKWLDIDVSADGRHAAIAGWDRTARIFDLDSLTEGPVMGGHDGNVNSVAFSADGKTLYTACYDGKIRAFNVADGTLKSMVYDNGWGINVVRALPDPRLLFFGALDGTAAIVDIEAQEIVYELGHHDGPVLSASVEPKAGLLAVGSADGHMRVYAIGDFHMLHDLTNAIGPVWALAFTPGGGSIYRAGLDDFAALWSISPRKPFEPMVGDYPRRFQASRTDDPGERQFARKCSVCHTLSPDDANRAGPTLYRVFGRKAGTLPGYPYSPALLNSDIVWNDETIGQLFDHGPDVVTPGTKMPIQRIKDAAARDALIAFLKRSTGGPATTP
ncbi:MAG: c-type cytochrome [Reyranellaceae bacterium]